MTIGTENKKAHDDFKEALLHDDPKEALLHEVVICTNINGVVFKGSIAAPYPQN